METTDTIVIGAGVVGLATARALAQTGREVLVLERHDAIGTETSSRNSEVIHAGIYYAQGSLKAQLCVRGKEQLYAYLRERALPNRQCGKLIVASGADQRASLNDIVGTAQAAGVTDLQYLDGQAISDLEPAVRGTHGLLSPSTGILDSHAFMHSLHGDLEAAGGLVVFRTTVQEIRRAGSLFEVLTLDAEGPTLSCKELINCAGLSAPTVADGIAGLPSGLIPTAHFAVGHYYILSGHSPFSRLVYPVPEPGGLGIHVTLDLAGQARFGPDVRWTDQISYTFDDTRRDQFANSIKSYYPGLDEDRLVPGYTGIRPKTAGPDAGFQDFIISGPKDHGLPGLVNLFGIESPGLTAALALGDHVKTLLAA